jgi:hypothetical protein
MIEFMTKCSTELVHILKFSWNVYHKAAQGDRVSENSKSLQLVSTYTVSECKIKKNCHTFDFFIVIEDFINSEVALCM